MPRKATNSTEAVVNPQSSVLVNEEAVSTTDATKIINKEMNAAKIRKHELAGIYKNENKVRVSGSPMYRPYFGNVMPICVNGTAVYLPLDGKVYEIPETFAAEYFRRIHRVDEQITARTKMADVTNNKETFAGEMNLITPVV